MYDCVTLYNQTVHFRQQKMYLTSLSCCYGDRGSDLLVCDKLSRVLCLENEEGYRVNCRAPNRICLQHFLFAATTRRKQYPINVDNPHSK